MIEGQVDGVGVEGFDLGGVFTALAKDDLNRAADLARTLTGEAARSVATLSVSQSVLAKPRERVNERQRQAEVRQ